MLAYMVSSTVLVLPFGRLADQFGRRRLFIAGMALFTLTSLGAGLSKVAGKLFRIGHLGDLNELMLLGSIAGSEMAMLDIGMKIEPGSGVAAAQSYWRNS